MGKPVVVLDFAGHDPCGGAGIQADIETIAALGAHCLPVITCHTIQNTQSFIDLQAVDGSWLKRQIQHLLDDIQPDAIKIGLLGSVNSLEVISEVLKDYRDVPIVMDPVLRSGSGTELSNEVMITAINQHLLPYCTVITPNRHEARTLSGCESLEQAAQTMIDHGCDFVLITGADEAEDRIENHFYGPQGLIQNYTWEKLPGNYHGSGCTLAAALTTFLSQDINVRAATEQAQAYTHKTLLNGIKIGQSQKHPVRVSVASSGLDLS